MQMTASLPDLPSACSLTAPFLGSLDALLEPRRDLLPSVIRNLGVLGDVEVLAEVRSD